jgi:alpha,alpha-trehalase
MYPWQSGSSGREESQDLHLNPQSGRWIPDVSNLQRHVNAAIAYNTWQYYQATRDMEFLAYYGAEMLLEIARFWAGIARYNNDRDRFEIRGVMGPDEFHTGYPDADEPGLNNNAYTNVMAAWVLCRAMESLELVGEDRKRELLEDLSLEPDELSRWDEISRKIFVPFHDNGIISQFEGYEQLEEFDWQAYDAKYGDIHRLDRILEAEGDTVNRYKASKQADALMLLYLFSADELCGLLSRLGYEFNADQIPENIDYYLRRTSHGSTLSGVVHSWVLARSDRKRASQLFEKALHSDIEDIQGGTTPEGIHLGAMAGTVDLIQRGHTGIEMREGVLWFNPRLPDALSYLRMRIRYRGHWLSIDLAKDKLTVSFDHGWSDSVRIGFGGSVYEMAQGDRREFGIKQIG